MVSETKKTEEMLAATVRPQVVLLIHGTFATSSKDEGTRWWQRGQSDFWRWLNARLCGVAEVQPVTWIFRWSGANSERVRREAGRKLLERLETLETAGIAYHLIGHSHGGSVIYEALKASTRRRQRLNGLRSWSTVGTPFLRFGAKASRLWSLLHFLYLTTLLTAVGWWTRFAWEHSNEINQGGNLAVLWFVTLILAVAALAWLGFGWNVVRWMLAIRSVVADRAAGRITLEWYGNQYLGLHAKPDEAINALKCTVGFRTRILPRRGDLFGVMGSTWRAWLLAPLRLLMRVVLFQPYEIAIAPLVDRFICDRVSEKAQGNDLDSQELVSVTAWPPSGPPIDSLSTEIERQLMDRADEAVKESARQLRRSLGEATIADDVFSNVFIGLNGTVGAAELVHISYFDQLEIREALAHQVIDFAVVETEIAAISTAPCGSAPPWLIKARAASAAQVHAPDSSAHNSLDLVSTREAIHARWTVAVVTVITLGIYGFLWWWLAPAPPTNSHQGINTEVVVQNADQNLRIALVTLCIAALLTLVQYGQSLWRRSGRSQSLTDALAHAHVNGTTRPTGFPRMLRAAATVLLVSVVTAAVPSFFAYLRPFDTNDAADQAVAALTILATYVVVGLLLGSMRIALAAEFPKQFQVHPLFNIWWGGYMVNVWFVPIVLLLCYSVVPFALREYTDEYQLSRMIRDSPLVTASARATNDTDSTREWARSLARARRYEDALNVADFSQFGNQVRREVALIASANGDHADARQAFKDIFLAYHFESEALELDLLLSERLSAEDVFEQSLAWFEERELQNAPKFTVSLKFAVVRSRRHDDIGTQRWLMRSREAIERLVFNETDETKAKLRELVSNDLQFGKLVRDIFEKESRNLDDLASHVTQPESVEGTTRSEVVQVDPDVMRLIEQRAENDLVFKQLGDIGDREVRLASARFFAYSFYARVERERFYELVKPKLLDSLTIDALLGQHAQVCADLHDFEMARKELEQIRNLEERSNASFRLACRLAEVGRTREAIQASQPCSTANRLRAFALILDQHRSSGKR